MISRAAPPVRRLCLGTCLVLVATAAIWVTGSLTSAARHPVTTDFGALLVSGAAWLLVAGSAWAAVLLGAVLAEVASHGRIAASRWVPCPEAWRRTLLAGLGLALSATPLVGVPAVASPDRASAPVLPPPVRPSGAVGTGDASGTLAPRARVEVQPGDSLWALTAERLPGDASAAVVARLVQRTYRANRGVIGADPDHIEPGQRLVLAVQEER